MEYRNSPYVVIQRLVAELEEGTLSGDAFLARVTRLQEKLERGYTRLEKMRPGDDCPDAQALVDAAADALRTVYQGLDMLHGLPQLAAPEVDEEEPDAAEDVFEDALAPTDDDGVPAEEAPPREVDVALDLVRQGCEAMAALVEHTEAREHELERLSGSLLDGLFG